MGLGAAQAMPAPVYSDFVKIEGDAYDPLQGRGFGKSFRNFVRRAMECFGIGQIGKKAALLAAQAKRRKPSGPNDWLRFAKACLLEQRCVGRLGVETQGRLAWCAGDWGGEPGQAC